jgi:ribonuclease HI
LTHQTLEPELNIQLIDITSDRVTVYTDGACLGNPGPGGYASILQHNGSERIITGQEAATTNNRMEMTAAIKALESVPPGATVVLHSDSELLIKGMTAWLPRWKAACWRTSARKPVANRDLWEALDALSTTRAVTWTWVKAHAGHPENERVDALANAQAASCLS